MSRKFYGLCLKSFIDLAKDCYTCSWMQARGIVFQFSNNFVETCLYALEIFKNIDIKYLFNFKEYFYLFDTFYKCCLKAYNSTPPTTTLSQRCHNVAVPAGQLCQESTVSFL